MVSVSFSYSEWEYCAGAACRTLLGITNLDRSDDGSHQAVVLSSSLLHLSSTSPGKVYLGSAFQPLLHIEHHKRTTSSSSQQCQASNQKINTYAVESRTQQTMHHQYHPRTSRKAPV
jgi:hypothetical protein